MLIQESIARYMLSFKRIKSTMTPFAGWEKAETILVTGVLNSNWGLSYWQELYKVLASEKKKFHFLIFTEQKETSHQPAPDMHVIGKKALNFYLQPKLELLPSSPKNGYDVLLCLSEQLHLPSQFICANSKANFRVGCYNDPFSAFDLILLRPNDMGTKEFTTEILRYLKKINI